MKTGNQEIKKEEADFTTAEEMLNILKHKLSFLASALAVHQKDVTAFEYDGAQMGLSIILDQMSDETNKTLAAVFPRSYGKKATEE